MDRESAIQEIKNRCRDLFPADRSGKGIICPRCGSGSGQHGTGMSEDPNRPGHFTCWNCNLRGDAIDLIQARDHCDFNTALQTAAEDLGITIDPYQPSAAEVFRQNTAQDAQNATGSHKTRIGDKNITENTKTPGKAADSVIGTSTKDYTAYYRVCSERLSDPAAVSYLQARGIHLETAAAIGIGFDPEADPAYSGHKAPRLIIPTSEAHYVGRSVDPKTPEKYQKMNVKGGKPGIFNVSALYSEQEAVFVTEGVFDALSVIECGAAAVALNSTSNARKLIAQLEQQPTEATLILCLDNDKAGKKATAELQKDLTRLNVSYVTADINCGKKDPNEALTADRDAFRNAIAAAEAQTAARPDNVRAYIENLMNADIERLQAAADRKTGFPDLDKKSGGLYPGLYVIAATSSLGKTTFSLQVADNLAEAGHDVLFFSMEQSRLELVSKSFSRILSTKDTPNDAVISSLSLRKGANPEKLKEAAAVYKKRVGDRMNIIEGNFNCNISFIGDYIRRYIRRNNTSPVVFIDYLQILQPAADARTTSVKETIDRTVTELKRISRELDVTVFVISSVNRANYMTPIDFESLKESGGIEYTADVVWGLQLQCIHESVFESANKIKEKRDKIREARAEMPRQIELSCLKNRYGISNFSSLFSYYPDRDLFVQMPGGWFPCDSKETPFVKVVNGKKIDERY
jgi:replicative DNA helicase